MWKESFQSRRRVSFSRIDGRYILPPNIEFSVVYTRTEAVFFVAAPVRPEFDCASFISAFHLFFLSSMAD